MRRVVYLVICLLWLMASSAMCEFPITDRPPVAPDTVNFQTPDSVAPATGTIGWALTHADQSSNFTLSDKVVSAAFEGYFYIEEDDRSAGIRVTSNEPVEQGERVNVTGSLGCISSGGNRGERHIVSSLVTESSSGNSAPEPLAMDNVTIGGANLTSTDLTPGISYALLSVGIAQGDGAYNKGLLIRTWGRVSEIAGTFDFYVNDGSMIDEDHDTPAKYGIDVKTPFGLSSLQPQLAVGDYVVVTGISSSRFSGGAIVPEILVRAENDIVNTVAHSSQTSDAGTIGNPEDGHKCWNLVSLPGIPYWGGSANPTADSVFNDTKPYCAANKLYANLFRWDTTTPQDNGSYISYYDPNGQYGQYIWFGPVYSTQGYWIKSAHTAQNGSIHYDAVTDTLIQRADAYIKLPYAATAEDTYSGLTMIGYPFQPNSQAYGNMYVTDGCNMLHISKAIDSHWVEANGSYWDNSETQAFATMNKVIGPKGPGVASTSLEPWRGYFIRSFKPNLALIIPYPAGTQDPASPLCDTTAPTITITEPALSEVHVASGDHIQIAGTATDAASGVACVEVAFTVTTSTTEPTTGWEYADYSRATSAWTYTWSSPQTKKIWAKATDFAGNTATTSKVLTVDTVTVIYVKPTGSDTSNGSTWALAKLTVQAGIDAASSGNEVWVAEGTYDDTHITMSSGVSVFGGFAATEAYREQRNWVTHETILDGDNVGSVVKIDGIVGCEVDGFTIQNGNGDGYVPAAQGGYCAGGGVYCHGGSAITVANNNITDNYAGYGGGICCTASSPEIRHNTIQVNSVSDEGGGMFCNAQSCPEISSNKFFNNNGASHGGGIALEDAGPSIINNVFSENYSGGTETECGGGGISVLGSTPVPCIINNTFVHNHVAGYGGAVLLKGVSGESGKVVAMYNDLFYNNEAGFGRSVYARDDCGPSTFADIEFCDAITPGGTNNGPTHYMYYNGGGYELIGGTDDAGGCLYVDPLFAYLDTYPGDGDDSDYHLQIPTGSTPTPIDRGINPGNTLYDGVPGVDIVGGHRPVDIPNVGHDGGSAFCDMGAYEIQE